MKIHAFALASLAFLTVAADTQKSAPPPASKESRDARQKDISQLLSVLGWPRANSEAARKQLEEAAKDPKLSSYPAAYWKDYAAAASPETFEKLLVPVFEKAYTRDEVRALLDLFGSPEFKKLSEKNSEGVKLFIDRNPGLVKNRAFQEFTAYMTEVGKKLREKHGIKIAEPKK